MNGVKRGKIICAVSGWLIIPAVCIVIMEMYSMPEEAQAQFGPQSAIAVFDCKKDCTIVDPVKDPWAACFDPAGAVICDGQVVASTEQHFATYDECVAGLLAALFEVGGEACNFHDLDGNIGGNFYFVAGAVPDFCLDQFECPEHHI